MNSSEHLQKPKVATKKMAMKPHGRSISLPTRLHPPSLTLQKDLNILQTLTQSPSPSSSSSIQSGLIALSNLYISINDLNSTHFHHHLETSVIIIDICNSARQILSSLKDQSRTLQSALRRQSSSIDCHVGEYIKFRKTSRKDVSKLKQLMEQTKSYDLDQLAPITASVFQPLFLLLSGANSRWSFSLIDKLGIGSRRSRYEVFNEVEAVDVALHCFSVDSEVDLRVLQERLEVMEFGISGMEISMDVLLRCLVQHRVSLLNRLSFHLL